MRTLDGALDALDSAHPEHADLLREFRRLRVDGYADLIGAPMQRA